MNLRKIPGFKFQPTDEELVNYFLFRKINGHPMIQERKIKDIDIYQHEPIELHGMYDFLSFYKNYLHIVFNYSIYLFYKCMHRVCVNVCFFLVY